jgi:thiol-activated cytolysin
MGMYMTLAKFIKVDVHGEVKTLKAHEGWSDVWDVIVPGKFGGGSHTDLLFYNRDGGEAKFHTTDGAGNLTLLKRDAWNKGIDLIVPGNFGSNDYTDLMMYGREEGAIYFYTTRGTGQIHHLHGAEGARKSWHSIVPGKFGGNAYTDLFFYDRTVGEGVFYATNGNGTMTYLAGHRMSKDWDIIVPGRFGGSGHTDLLFYRRRDGRAKILTSDGQGGLSLVKDTSFRRTWDMIIPGSFGGNEFGDLFFYDRDTGEAKFVTTDGAGNLRELNVEHFRRGWGIVVPGTFDNSGRTTFLLYGNKFPERHKLTVRLGKERIQHPPRRIGGQQEERPRRNIVCQVQKVELTESFNQQLSLNLRQNVIWPGAILDGGSLVNGQYRPITAARAPMRLSISLTGVRHPAVTVDQPTLSNVREKINGLLLQRVHGRPDSIQIYHKDEVYSEEQLQIAAGVAFDGGVFSVKGDFNFTGYSTRHKYLVKYVQQYYTIDVDPPQHPRGWFAQQRAIADDEVYVASVAYGRLLFFSLQSAHDQEEMSAAIEAAYGPGRGQVSAKHKAILEDSSIRVLVLGGGGEDASAPITDGVDGIRQYIQSGAKFDADSPGLPIYYTLKYVKDNADAYTTMTTTYYERHCATSAETLIVHVKDLVLEEVGDAGDDLELYGKIEVRATRDDFNTLIVNKGVWNYGRDNWVRVRKGVPHQIDKTVRVSFTDIHKADDDYKLQVLAWLKDYDDTSKNDDLGWHGETISLPDLKPGKTYRARINARDHATGYISFDVLQA